MTFVIAMHGVIIAALWHYQVRISPTEALTVFVNFISPPASEKKAEPPKAEKPHPVENPKIQRLAAEAPVTSPTDFVAPPPPPEVATEETTASEPAIEAPSAPQAPVTLSTELAVSCPDRAPPFYPSVSRRLGEQGRVVLRVELDDRGHVSSVTVSEGSGLRRLDEAAMTAVRNWRCAPAMRDGAPARAVALQQFDFILKGR